MKILKPEELQSFYLLNLQNHALLSSDEGIRGCKEGEKKALAKANEAGHVGVMKERENKGEKAGLGFEWFV